MQDNDGHTGNVGI